MYIRDEYSSTIDMITFVYLKETLFNKISLLSQYRAKNIVAQDGKSLIDELSITEDEEDVAILQLNESMHDCFNDVVKMTKQITNSLFVDETKTLGSSSTQYPHAYGFSIRDHDAYNSNVLSLVDEAIENYLIYSTLLKWYKLNRMGDDAADLKNTFDEIRRDLINRRLFQLRKPLISS